MTTTLSFFWDLSSNNKGKRLDASTKLVSALQHFQSQHVPVTTSDDEDGEDDDFKDPLDTLNAQDVSYSIRRLVRGLASPRESSRLGFSVALTELLSRLDTVTCSQVLTLILDASKPQGSVTGQEERDLLFAQLFGLTALIQSRLFVRTTPLATSASSSAVISTAQAATDVFERLVALGEKKSWLRESAWWAILLGLERLADSEVEWKDHVLNGLVGKIFEEDTKWSPEKVAVVLKMQQLVPKADWKALLGPTFKNPDILASVNLQALAKILKETNSEEEGDFSRHAPGSWKPQLHYVWDVILDHLLPQKDVQKRTTPTTGTFQEFFRVVVDESFFSATASVERKFLGFEVFRKALPRVDATTMPMLFTQNFMRSWINHLSGKERQLHKAALQVASEVTVYAKENPSMGFTLILQLTGANGSRHFDKLTKTKTVESLLTAMDAEGIKSYVGHLMAKFNNVQTEDVQSLNSSRGFIIDQLAALVRSPAVPNADEWVISILDWLTVHGLFVVRKESKKSSFSAVRHGVLNPALSDEIRSKARAALLSCLSDLSSQSTVINDGDKASKLHAVASDGEFWAQKTLKSIERLEKDTKHVSLLEEIAQEEADGQRSTVREICSQLHELSTPAAQGAELLLSGMVLNDLCGMRGNGEDEDADTDAVQLCADSAKLAFLAPSPKKSKKSKKERASAASVPEDPTSPPPIDVFVDAIIGFLEQSTGASAFLRTIGKQAFSLLSGMVQESTVELMLSQLESKSAAELLADDDDQMDVDMSDGVEDGVEGSDEEDEDSDEDVEEDDEDLEDQEENVELRRKIEEALRINGIEAATGDSDGESEEELMDDDQMLAIDEQLAQVFKSQMRTGKDVNAQREATHFKNRVLDLVDIYLSREPQNPLALRFVLPLVDLVSTTGGDERQLEDKANGLVRSRFGKAKDVPSDIDQEGATSSLQALHGRARKDRSPNLVSVLSVCALYTARVLVNAGQMEAATAVYRESLQDFIQRKNSSLNTAFFQDFIRRLPAAAWSLRDSFIDITEQAANVYRRCQAFHLVQILLNVVPSLDVPENEVTKYMARLSKSLSSLVTRACQDEIVLTSAQMKDILKVTLVAIRQTCRILSASGADTVTTRIKKIWDQRAWEEVGVQLEKSERFKAAASLKSMVTQISQVIDGKTKAGSASNEKVKKGTPGAAAESVQEEPKTSRKQKTGKRKVEQVNGKEPSSSKKKLKQK